MEKEFFDIVDENNEPTGEKKPREIVHKEMVDWHRATHIWILNKQKEILCQQRSLIKDQNPGMWQSFFGGHLKAGQSYLTSAAEELNEELGIKINYDSLIPLHVKQSESFKHFGQVYVFYWDGEVANLKFSKEEIQQVKWFTVGELKKLADSGQVANSVDQKVVEFINQR